MRHTKIIKFRNSHITEKYLRIFNGVFNLTPRELQILAAFIDVYKSIHAAGLADNVFDTIVKKQVAKLLEFDDFNTLNPYIQSLRRKNAIVKMDKGHTVHPFLMPYEDEKEIVFKLV